MNKWAVVVPTVRPEKFKQFWEAWLPLFAAHNANVIVVYDGENKSEFLERMGGVLEYDLYDWKDIKTDLGDSHWIIPRKTDCVRSYGFYKAWQTDCDYILTLDDDVLPIFDTFAAYEKVFDSGAIVSNYFNVGSLITRPSGLFMRGFPFEDRQPRKVMLQYGMWAGVPDLDGMTQLQYPVTDARALARIEPVPKDIAVTGCIMNCAFRREFTPNFYQLLMGKDWPFDRWGDIWSGLIAKKICDNNNWAVVINGEATVKHTRASDVYTNIKKEASGYGINSELWSLINSQIYQEPNPKHRDIVQRLCRGHAFYNDDYETQLMEAAILWSNLFTK